MENFVIQLGEFRAEYVALITDAPKIYDGFGTMTVQEFGHPLTAPDVETKGDARLVLVRAEHLNWQQSRYSSGLHASHMAPDFFRPQDLAEKLFQKLTL